MLRMVAERPEPSGLLMVKVRLRADDRAPELIATITATLDLTTREDAHETAGSIAETMVIVKRWLEAFVAADSGDGTVTDP